jgi:hypothetical protein
MTQEVSMVTRIRRRLTFANVLSVAALFVALGGSAYALGRNSVGTNQLKKNAVTTAKIKKGAVDGSKVKDGSLTGADLATATIDASKLGPGAVGSGGIASGAVVGSKLGPIDTHVVATPLPDTGVLARAVAFCDPGEKLIGGGVNTATFGKDIIVEASRPSKPDTSEVENGEAFESWETSAINVPGETGATAVRAWAVCLR